jgi:hypothetical protein
VREQIARFRNNRRIAIEGSESFAGRFRRRVRARVLRR